MSDSDFSAPFNALIEHLDSKSFTYSSYPEEKRVCFSICGKHANYDFVFRITHEEELLQISARYPFFVREEKLRPTVAELLTRANYNLLLGNFEMDMKDGEVRFHVTHMIVDGLLADVAIDKAYRAILFTMDRYFPALMQHIHAGYTPEDAIFHAELDMHADAVEETPKPASKSKEKGKPKAPESVTRNTTSKPQRKPARKKSGGGNGGQGELPI
jgi:hypothetical protein